uniref:PIFI-like Ig-like domain-containing protein n=1 Tax=Physcomitrium patens TaxID=3218 RepID=A0A7I4AUP7_PHYPA
MATLVYINGSGAAACCSAASSSHEAAGIRRRATKASVASSLVSRFYGLQLAAEGKVVRSQNSKVLAGKATATAVVNSTGVKHLPTWADFEMGLATVYWETSNGLPPTSGQLLTIYFNPSASELTPNTEYGIGFNGGFNQPIMCGGEPRIMAKKERGSLCETIYAIKINVPLHALTLEFSFTDGKNWDGPYKLVMEVPQKLKGLPQSYFDEGLAKELAHEGACENAIFPDSVYVQDRCVFPAGMIQEGGDRCDLDIVPGCTDPESPFYDPLANVDDGSCPFILEEES